MSFFFSMLLRRRGPGRKVSSFVLMVSGGELYPNLLACNSFDGVVTV